MNPDVIAELEAPLPGGSPGDRPVVALRALRAAEQELAREAAEAVQRLSFHEQRAHAEKVRAEEAVIGRDELRRVISQIEEGLG